MTRRKRSLLPTWFAWADLPPVVVCERTSRWAVAWQTTPDDPRATRSLVVIETRSLSECRDTLAWQDAAVVLVSLDVAPLAATLDMLAWLDRLGPRVVTVVVGEARWRAVELSLREFGAAAVVTSPGELPAIRSLAWRHACRRARPPLAWSEVIWASLPWVQTTD